MSIIAWILLGLVAGFLGSKVVTGRGEGVLADFVLGVIGALVGGCLFRLIGAENVTGLNIPSVFVAMIGSIALLVIYHAAGWPRARRT